MPQTITIDGFGGGINARVPAVDIQDNEVVDAKNMEIDGNRTLVTRPGLSEFYDKGGTPYAFGSQSIIGMAYYRDSTLSVSKGIAATTRDRLWGLPDGSLPSWRR